MKIFLTGGTGFLGSHFLKLALDVGVQVRALRRTGSQPRIPLPAEPDWIDGNLSDAQPDWFEGCDVLVHLAAVGVSPQHVTWSVAHQVNVADSMRLAEVAHSAGIRRFLVCGTCMEYGKSAENYEFIPANAELLPSGPYAASKAACFLALRAFVEQFNLHMTYLRPFHFFGDGQSEQNFWPSLRKAALAGEDFSMTLGEQIRDFTPVEEVAQRFLAEAVRLHNGEGMMNNGEEIVANNEFAIRYPPSAIASPAVSPSAIRHSPSSIGRKASIRIANVGTGRPQTLREFAEYWWKKWNASGKLLVGAVPYRENEVMRYVPDVEKRKLEI